MIRALRAQWRSLQLALMHRASAAGLTQAAVASQLGCSDARVSHWTSREAREMTLQDLLGVLEIAPDPVEILRPLHDALGLACAPRPTSEGEHVGRLEGGVLSLQVGLGAVASQVQAATVDGEVDDQEADRIVDSIDEQLRTLTGMRTMLTEGRRRLRPVGGAR